MTLRPRLQLFAQLQDDGMASFVVSIIFAILLATEALGNADSCPFLGPRISTTVNGDVSGFIKDNIERTDPSPGFARTSNIRFWLKFPPQSCCRKSKTSELGGATVGGGDDGSRLSSFEV